MLALAAQGCDLDLSGHWKADEEVCGVRVKWNGQGDREALCPELESCRTALGFAFDGGAAVEFVGDPVAACLRDHVAGCFTPDFDHIYLVRAERIGDTALCHELLHRELFFARGGDPDYAHASPLWQQVP